MSVEKKRLEKKEKKEHIIQLRRDESEEKFLKESHKKNQKSKEKKMNRKKIYKIEETKTIYLKKKI